MKVLMILVDGMRPDALENVDRAQRFIKQSAYTMKATTVMPSVTLPCHLSLFLSVDPSRHGTTTNTYAPQVRPVKGLCEVLFENKKTSAIFYSWEELRDVAKPGMWEHSCLVKGHSMHHKTMKDGFKRANDVLTDEAIKYISENETDFAFLYLGYTDAAGHSDGWKTEGYMESIENSWDNIEKIVSTLDDDYTVIILADHGGHDRLHGTDLPEDMTIPVIIKGKDFEAGKLLEDVNIKDISPTIVKLLGTDADEEWEGKSLL